MCLCARPPPAPAAPLSVVLMSSSTPAVGSSQVRLRAALALALRAVGREPLRVGRGDGVRLVVARQRGLREGLAPRDDSEPDGVVEDRSDLVLLLLLEQLSYAGDVGQEGRLRERVGERVGREAAEDDRYAVRDLEHRLRAVPVDAGVAALAGDARVHAVLLQPDADGDGLAVGADEGRDVADDAGFEEP